MKGSRKNGLRCIPRQLWKSTRSVRQKGWQFSEVRDLLCTDSRERMCIGKVSAGQAKQPGSNSFKVKSWVRQGWKMKTWQSSACQICLSSQSKWLLLLNKYVLIPTGLWGSLNSFMKVFNLFSFPQILCFWCWINCDLFNLNQSWSLLCLWLQVVPRTG